LKKVLPAQSKMTAILKTAWSRGWFSEATDEISEKRALEIIARMSKR